MIFMEKSISEELKNWKWKKAEMKKDMLERLEKE